MRSSGGNYLGSEALRIGHGGINQVMKASGASWETIKRGLEEIQAGELYEPGERIRKEGGGRKSWKCTNPGVARRQWKRSRDPKGDR